MMEFRNDLIDACAQIAGNYAKVEKEKALQFGKVAKKEPNNPQWNIAQATHTILSVICERIADDIRKLKNEST